MSNCIVKTILMIRVGKEVSSQDIHYLSKNRVFGGVIVYFLFIFYVVLFILFVLALCLLTNVARGSEISIFANSFFHLWESNRSSIKPIVTFFIWCFVFKLIHVLNIVKPAHAVTSNKQSPVLKVHLFSYPA